MTVEDALREMGEVASQGLHDACSSWKVAQWLEVLRDALTSLPTVGQHDIESFALSSGLRQESLRDLRLRVELDVDHEGGGAVKFEYAGVPYQHRLQALLSCMGAIGTRIELALGAEAYLRLLRGVIVEREGR